MKRSNTVRTVKHVRSRVLVRPLSVMRALTITMLFVMVVPAMVAQDYSPVPGGELLDQLRSPLFLATTANTASTQ